MAPDSKVAAEFPREIRPTNSFQWKPRLRACAIHLGLSLAVATLLMILLNKVWYPKPFFDLASGRDIFILILCCDLVLGPLLTFVVFNAAKARAELVRDLAVIAVLQVAAMSYGLRSVLASRPVFIVYNSGQFNVTLANEVVADNESTANDKPLAIPWLGPELFAVHLPEDVSAHNRLMFSALQGSGDVFQMPRYFIPYDDARAEIKNRTRTPEQLADELHVSGTGLAAAISTYSQKPERAVGVLPAVVRGRIAIAVVDRATGDFIGIEPMPPTF